MTVIQEILPLCFAFHQLETKILTTWANSRRENCSRMTFSQLGITACKKIHLPSYPGMPSYLEWLAGSLSPRKLVFFPQSIFLPLAILSFKTYDMFI